MAVGVKYRHSLHDIGEESAMIGEMDEIKKQMHGDQDESQNLVDNLPLLRNSSISGK